MKTVKLVIYYGIRRSDKLANIVPALPFQRPGSEAFFNHVKKNNINQVLYALTRDKFLKF